MTTKFLRFLIISMSLTVIPSSQLLSMEYPNKNLGKTNTYELIQKNKKPIPSHQDRIALDVAKKTAYQQFVPPKKRTPLLQQPIAQPNPAQPNLKTRLQSIAKTMSPLIIPPLSPKSPQFLPEEIAPLWISSLNQPSFLINHSHNN